MGEGQEEVAESTIGSHAVAQQCDGHPEVHARPTIFEQMFAPLLEAPQQEVCHVCDGVWSASDGPTLVISGDQLICVDNRIVGKFRCCENRIAASWDDWSTIFIGKFEHTIKWESGIEWFRQGVAQQCDGHPDVCVRHTSGGKLSNKLPNGTQVFVLQVE